MKSSGLSRRIEKSIELLITKDYESVLLNLFPAMEKTAKKRYPKHKVGERFKMFIREECRYMTGLTTSSSIGNFASKDMDLAEAIYKFARNPLIHEAELDFRISINENDQITFGPDYWSIPTFLLLGMILVVILAPENKNESGCNNYHCEIFGNIHLFGELWGKKSIMKKKLEEKNWLERF